ncbi:alcohol dehydrogenase [Penicillium macrosclerotiorum]|uniref:alcohol dehydrogenase n=1 Tax=Penicillium macrosclerotiorum TaxID=303699 RepID=UPI0025470730|nr:alcohol dehydrogenase [Penicillium macrosclerotiorum]KAJ5691856.1 alcohol dehydrogenase [Penicillium macrosclerotiorum]
MSPFVNEAAWIPSPNTRPLQLGPGPTPDPAENEVVIKVAYAAVNPVDWKVQDFPGIPLPYPFIFGTDVAGTVAQVGSQVTRFHLGQRVIGHCDGFHTKKATNAAYQLYSTCNEILVSPVPESLPLANAAVLPIAVDTAATALYAHLKLPLPTLAPKPIGKRILIWGGSSSVGTAAIQLAVASGLEVVTTASSANHELMKSLGATHVFNYKDPDTVNNLTALLKPQDYVVDCISTKDTQVTCGEILGKVGGGLLPVMTIPEETLPDNVQSSFVICLDIETKFPHLGEAIWHDFIPRALAAGSFQAKPDPQIVYGGLSKVQEAIDLQRKGVSARKVVVEISPED